MTLVDYVQFIWAGRLCRHKLRRFAHKCNKKEIKEARETAYSLPRKITSPKLSKNIDLQHRDRKARKLPPYFALSLQAELSGW